MENFPVGTVEQQLFHIESGLDDLTKAVNGLKSSDDARWLALITAILCLRREYDLDGDLSPVRVQDAQDKAIELLKKMKKKSRVGKPVTDGIER